STPSAQTAPIRDLNKNGRVDPYEDPRRPIEERIEDLLGQMTLEEKAGLLFQTMVPLDTGHGSPPGLTPASELVTARAMSHFNPVGSARPQEMAAWHNQLQEVAERTRLGIPVTLSTDPRHAFSATPGASMHA